MTFVRSLGGALGVAVSGTIMSTRLAGAVSGAGNGMSLGMLTQHGMGSVSELTHAQQAGISAAYHTALTGSFLLSAVVMTMAFLLVVGLPEIRLRNQIEEVPAE
jgi:hypothetical protein